MQISTRFTVFSAAGVLLLSGCGNAAEDETGAGQATATEQAGSALTVSVRDAEDTEVGTVQFSEVEGGTQVAAQVEGLEPGFYGLHIHGTGLCEPGSAAPDDPSETGAFLSAGGHLGSEEGNHPDHAGDLPSLYATDSGQGNLMTHTDRFTIEDLQDEDGSAVMIHTGTDNYANIPERYAPEGPDEETLNTGDAGSRLACGVVE